MKEALRHLKTLAVLAFILLMFKFPAILGVLIALAIFAALYSFIYTLVNEREDAPEH